MLRIDGLNEDKVLTITVGGKLTKQDYTQLLPQVAQMLDEHGKLHFYLKLEDFSGFEMAAMWEELKFDIKYKDRFGKVAVVGEKEWEKWGTKISAIFFPSETRFFYKDQTTQAWQWINA